MKFSADYKVHRNDLDSVRLSEYNISIHWFVGGNYGLYICERSGRVLGRV